MTDPLSAMAAIFVFLGGTAAILGLTLMWALSNRHPVHLHARRTGRSAAPYWHSRTGHADERGITARAHARRQNNR